MRRPGLLVASLAVAALLLAGTVAALSAKTIRGSARSERINGSPSADVIYAGGGNDVVYGYGGNDRIYAGAGRDRVFCGTGNDVAYGDRSDTFARDCEIIRKGVSRPNPPAPTVSHWEGTTGQTGKTLSFDVTAASRLINLVVEYKASCPSGNDYHAVAKGDPNALVSTDRTFSFFLRLPERAQIEMEGKWDNTRGVFYGTFELHQNDCDTSTVTWTAHKR